MGDPPRSKREVYGRNNKKKEDRGDGGVDKGGKDRKIVNGEKEGWKLKKERNS